MPSIIDRLLGREAEKRFEQALDKLSPAPSTLAVPTEAIPAEAKQIGFLPADEGVSWRRIETLVHGPGSGESELAAANATLNSVVFSCLMALCMSYIEPPLKVYRRVPAPKAPAIPPTPTGSRAGRQRPEESGAGGESQAGSVSDTPTSSRSSSLTSQGDGTADSRRNGSFPVPTASVTGPEEGRTRGGPGRGEEEPDRFGLAEVPRVDRIRPGRAGAAIAVSALAEWLGDSPLQELLDFPSQTSSLSMEEFLFWTQWAKHTVGDAYWLKIRSGHPVRGNVVGLELVSPLLLTPLTVKGSGDFISYYQLEVAPGIFERVPVENVIHFRHGIDPLDHRHGLSPLKRLIRHIATDEEADKFTQSLLKNYAMPGLVVTTQDMLMDQETADVIKERVRSNFGNDGRGGVAVLSNGATISGFGFSPEQLNLQVLHAIPEQRIAAVMRVPPIVANLGVGLNTATYSNYKQAREAFTEDTLAPLWRLDAATITRQLKPDFSSDKRVYVAFDLSEVRSLQEDETAKYSRLNMFVSSHIMSINEARAEVGLGPVEGGDEVVPPPPPPPPPNPFQSQSPFGTGEGEEAEGEEGAGSGFADLLAGSSQSRFRPTGGSRFSKGTTGTDPYTSAILGEIKAVLDHGDGTSEELERTIAQLWREAEENHHPRNGSGTGSSSESIP